MPRAIGTMTVLGAVIMGLSLSGSPVSAQEVPWPTLDPDWTAPRTAWDTPDLHGIWSSKSSAPMQRPEEHADRAYLTDEEVADLDAASEERETNPAAQGRDVARRVRLPRRRGRRLQQHLQHRVGRAV